MLLMFLVFLRLLQLRLLHRQQHLQILLSNQKYS